MPNADEQQADAYAVQERAKQRDRRVEVWSVARILFIGRSDRSGRSTRHFKPRDRIQSLPAQHHDRGFEASLFDRSCRSDCSSRQFAFGPSRGRD